ncbi:MAG: hypothetical protein K1X88_19665 [Nannocystaceae bacterium]|nr:hypothetical protein [Nannocystaceae bacterium]
MAIVAWLVASPAFAGGVMHNAFGIPRAEDGRGVKVGERSTFHAGFALGLGVDTNVYSNARTEDKVASSFLWPSTWIGIGNREIRDGLLMTPAERSGRWFDYNISLLGGFRQYLSRQADVRSVPRFSIGTQVRLAILPGRKFSIHLDEDFFRGASAGNYQALGSVLNFNRIDHRGQLTMILRPGGGRLSFAVGYRSQYLHFENDNLFKSNRIMNGFYHETKWRFLPRSSIVLNYTMDYTYYVDCCSNPGTGRNEDNYAHRLLAGYRGQLAQKVALEAMAGWGGGFYRTDPNGPSFNSFIGRAAVNYFPTLRSLIHVALYRNYQDSLFGNYYVDNGGTLAVGHQFRWRMIGHLGFNVAARKIAGLPVIGVEIDNVASYTGPGAGQYQRKTAIVGVDAKLEQPLGKVFALSLGYNLVADTRPFYVEYQQQNNSGDNQVDNLSYFRHLVTLVLAVRI